MPDDTTPAAGIAKACPADSTGTPSPRAGAAATSDGGGLLLFGGTDATGRALADTWTYRCGRWSQLSPPSTPPPLAPALAVFDTDAREARLVAGDGSVWTWRNEAWRLLAAAGGLPTLTNSRAVYDTAGKRLMVVGVKDAILETWGWRDQQWRRLAVTQQLGKLERFGLAHHTALGKTILFGGVSDGDMLVSAAYLWDGTSWVSADGDSEAPQGPVIAGYDETRRTIVAIDDIDARTWLWNGAWTLTTAQGPGRLWGSSVGYDPSAEALTLFGGDRIPTRSGGESKRSNDSWRWDGRAWAASPGTS